jgi:hypothetical protein
MPMAVDLHHFCKEQDPDPDPHQSERSALNLGILTKVKGRIRIRNTCLLQ